MAQIWSFHSHPSWMAENGSPEFWLKSEGRLPQGFTLQRTSQSRGAGFTAIVYRIVKEGIPVHECMVSVLRAAKGGLVTSNFPEDLPFESSQTTGKNTIWYKTRNKYCLVSYHDSGSIRTFSHADFTTRTEYRRNFNKDTTVKAKVHAPDPLSRANVLYGGIWKDSSDGNPAHLNEQRFWLPVTLRKAGDTLKPESDKLIFREISIPVYPAGYSFGNPDFGRDVPAFEDFNAFVHIQSLSRWWDSLGFADWSDTVQIDAHAMGGADESGYNPLLTPPAIEFGTGGVDDAEDADVCVHEYTHAAFGAVVPDSYVGSQRQAIEEGVCYFVAVAYSLRHTPNQAGIVNNWDGHNEFYPGYTLLNNKMYGKGMTNQPHVDGEIWGAALYDLSRETGTDSTMKLVLQSMPLMVAGMGMQKAAEVLLRTDSLLNNARNRWPIIKAFYPRNLLPSLGISEVKKEIIFKVFNSEGFAHGENAEIISNQPGLFRMMDSRGLCVREYKVQAWQKCTISASGLSAGVYYLQGGNQVVKMLLNQAR
ncbi:MAG: hypothetical protein JNL57_00490 [Bacteroidetes bacterium]|nr:hypothetical protein [Bacteroidota bacterium]